MKSGLWLLAALVVVALAFFLWQPDKVVGEQGDYGALATPIVPEVSGEESKVLSEVEEAGSTAVQGAAPSVAVAATPSPDLVDLEELPAEQRDAVIRGVFSEMEKEASGGVA